MVNMPGTVAVGKETTQLARSASGLTFPQSVPPQNTTSPPANSVAAALASAAIACAFDHHRDDLL